jgi:mannose-6-phosphate isomerase
MSVRYPLVLAPVYKDYIWGGTRISSAFGRNLPPGVYAESWEVSDREEGASVVANGPKAGVSLRDLIASDGVDVMGPGGGSRFPLLIKIIDAAKCLSVQVHPSNENAASVGGDAKTEMWYVLAADPGAGVYAGFERTVTPEEFSWALAEQRVDKLLRFVEVAAGDVVFIPGGRVHAIDKGCLLLEIQQNSNTTYRVYDWGRLGHDGKPRELHVDQAMRVLSWDDDGDPKVVPDRVERGDRTTRWRLIDSPLFRVDRIELGGSLTVTDNAGFQALFVASGSVVVESEAHKEEVALGTSCLVPAAVPTFTLTPLNGTAEVIVSTA